MATVMADAAGAGGYFSLAKIIVMLLMLVPWMLVSPWVHRDAKRVLAPVEICSGSILGAGALGFALWLVMPAYILGLAIYVITVGAATGAYIVYRNGRCEEKDRITLGNIVPTFLGQIKGPKAVEVVTHVKLYDYTAKIVLAPGETADEDQRLGYNEAQELLFGLLHHRASEADLVPKGSKARVRLAIDGVVSELAPLELATSERIIQYLKPVAGMDVDERRRPQQGTIAVDLLGKHTDVMLTTTGTTDGQRLQLRIVGEAVQTDLTELGLNPDTIEQISAANASQTGLIIVAGKPRSGVTSTLYSLLRQQDAFMKQLTTLEAKPLVDLENITQIAYENTEDLPKALAAAARRDPDVIMVDRCSDQTTADLIQRISEIKFVLLGVQAKDSFVAMAKWAKLCGDAAKAVEPLLGISCQLLLRKLCLECRHPYKPDPQLLAKANISGEKIDVFYRKPRKGRLDPKGKPIICGACQESGFVGRTGVFEFLTMTDDIKKLVIDGADVRNIKAACRKNGMLNLQEQALRKVIAGATSINEVIRVTQEAKTRQ